MIKVAEFSLEHVNGFIPNTEIEDLEGFLTKRNARGEFLLTIVKDTEVLGFAGLILHNEFTAEPWLILSKNATASSLGLIRLLRASVQWLFESGITRIQATTKNSSLPCDRFLSVLGFRFETELPGYGGHKSDYKLFARVKPCHG
jgi:hypothetical protein